MTGLELAQLRCSRTYLAERDYYHWWRRAVLLRPSVASGRGPIHLLIAAHECAHHRQNMERPWLKYFLWFTPILLFVEVDAWLRALVMVTE